jgi:hypothetical protein
MLKSEYDDFLLSLALSEVLASFAREEIEAGVSRKGREGRKGKAVEVLEGRR